MPEADVQLLLFILACFIVGVFAGAVTAMVLA